MVTSELIKNKVLNKLQSLQGKIFSSADGIVRIFGLPSTIAGELLFFPSVGLYGIAFNLEKNRVGAIICGDSSNLKQNDSVVLTGKLASVKVSNSMFGSIVDSLGTTVYSSESNESKIDFKECERILDGPAPAILDRFPVEQPLLTGILAIDSLIPIGRGQRQLIIGDRQTGKTQITLDTILNLTNQNVNLISKGLKPTICVYVRIGQKSSVLVELQNQLASYGTVSDSTIFVHASAEDPAAMRYLAPFTGTAIAESFMLQGYDAVVVYDDLTKHAQAYREMSLLLKRPPGREAYPGDIFWIHARLLERSAQLKDGGSLTAFPIIETQSGDISAYIPTNVISITDGQIYLTRDLFNQGIRPAIDIGLSVSRIGSAAQPKSMKKLSGKLKLTLAQFYELQAFSQFGSEMDSETAKQLDSGLKLTRLFIQNPFNPYSLDIELILLYWFQNFSIQSVDLIPKLIDQIKELFSDFDGADRDFFDSRNLDSLNKKLGQMDI